MLKESLKDILIALKFLFIKISESLKKIEKDFDPEVPPGEKPMNQPLKKTAREIIQDAAFKAVGLDLTPDDNIPDGLACVAQLVRVIEKTPYCLPTNLTYTPYLKNALDLSPHWRRITEPKSGCIVVSPTQGNTIGHCGILITDLLIASNNSFGTWKGKWTNNYGWPEWVAYFKGNKGLHIYIYEPID